MIDFYNNYLNNKVKIERDKFYNIINDIFSKYVNVPYHSQYHGNDVMNFGARILLKSNLNLNKIDYQSFILALAGHDISHPGLNNKVKINKINKIYGGDTPLEEFHFIQTKTILSKYQINFNEKLLEEVILSTNPNRDSIGKYKNLGYIAKVADINHCVNSFDKHLEWIDKLERELDIKISPKNQINFLENYALITLQNCKDLINDKCYQKLMFKLNCNINYWKNKEKSN